MGSKGIPKRLIEIGIYTMLIFRKNIIAFIFLILVSPMAIVCEENRFSIFYLPIEAEFYIPPTREYIMKHGINFDMDSCLLKDFFSHIFAQEGVKSQINDQKGLRIMIINKTDRREIFITSDKKILSVDKNKKYNIEIEIVNNVLKEIRGLIKTKKLE